MELLALALALGVGMTYSPLSEEEAQTIVLLGSATYPEDIISFPNGKMLAMDRI